MIEISEEIAEAIKGKEYKKDTLFNPVKIDGIYYISESEAMCLTDFGFKCPIKEVKIEKKK